MTSVASVAGHTGTTDMVAPVDIDRLVHLDHAPGDDFLVNLIRGQVFQVMAVFAALFRCDPFRDRSHELVELVIRKIAQYLYVLVKVAGAISFRIGLPGRFGNHVRGLQRLKFFDILFQIHAGAPVADLGGFDRRGVPAGTDKAGDSEQGSGGSSKRYPKLHFPSPYCAAGSTTFG